jgi:excisionase family DNA binding protein
MSGATALERGPLLSTDEQAAKLPISARDQEEIEQLYAAFRKGKAKLISPTGESKVLPESLYSFLVELIGRLNEGKSVMIVQNEAKLTTVQAASILGVSRQFLVNLLEKGEIPHHLVGTHRRIYAKDLFGYKAHRDSKRHKIIEELAKAEMADGLYERTLDDVD